MIALLCFFLTLFASPFKSKSRLEAENAMLRRQLIILRRREGFSPPFTVQRGHPAGGKPSEEKIG